MEIRLTWHSAMITASGSLFCSGSKWLWFYQSGVKQWVEGGYEEGMFLPGHSPSLLGSHSAHLLGEATPTGFMFQVCLGKHNLAFFPCWSPDFLASYPKASTRHQDGKHGVTHPDCGCTLTTHGVCTLAYLHLNCFHFVLLNLCCMSFILKHRLRKPRN